MSRFRDWHGLHLSALAVLFAAVGWAFIGLVNAVILAPLPQGVPNDPPRRIAITKQAVEPQTPFILQAVAANPMRPDRHRAPGRFGQIYVVPEPDAPPPPVPIFRVAGVVNQTHGENLAAIAVGRASPRLVRQGEFVEGFQLVAVRRDSILLVRPDTIILVAVPGYIQPGKTD